MAFLRGENDERAKRLTPWKESDAEPKPSRRRKGNGANDNEQTLLPRFSGTQRAERYADEDWDGDIDF